MSDGENCLHYVSTLDEAARLIGSQEEFWTSNCGCRESRKRDCARGRLDVCLQFHGRTAASGSDMKRRTRAEAIAILEHARMHGLVARPFRDLETKRITEGICFCCDDCCGYFLDGNEACDRGTMVEKTRMEECTHCGACAGACHFKARTISNGKLEVIRELCYGCGLCVTACPSGCIGMTAR